MPLYPAYYKTLRGHKIEDLYIDAENFEDAKCRAEKISSTLVVEDAYLVSFVDNNTGDKTIFTKNHLSKK